MKPSLSIASAALAICGSWLPASCAHKPPVQWMVNAPMKTVKPGSRFLITVHGAIEPGWHVYALQEPDGGPIATEVSLAENGPIHLLRVDQSKPRTLPDPVFQVATSFFAEDVDFTLHLKAGPSAVTGPSTVHVLVRYQTCNDRMCLPPHTDSVDVSLTLAK